MDGACKIFEDIGRLLVSSEQTPGIWSNGLAIYELFLSSFGKREGPAAVLEFLKILRIEPHGDQGGILTLALAMLVNRMVKGNKHCQ